MKEIFRVYLYFRYFREQEQGCLMKNVQAAHVLISQPEKPHLFQGNAICVHIYFDGSRLASLKHSHTHLHS